MAILLPSPRVLIVEDQDDLSRSVAFALEGCGYQVRIAARGAMALELVRIFHPDVMLLDLVLPDMSGLDVCRTARALADVDPPSIIIVSARAQEADRVLGFEAGADDYIVKPFNIRELTLRIESRIKHRQAESGASSTAIGGAPVLRLRNLRVDEASHRVFVDEREVNVSLLEMKLLLHLFHAAGSLVSKRELLTEVWGYQSDVTSRTVDTHVKRLRDKLGTAADLVQTVRGLGIRLAKPQSVAGDISAGVGAAKQPASSPRPRR